MVIRHDTAPAPAGSGATAGQAAAASPFDAAQPCRGSVATTVSRRAAHESSQAARRARGRAQAAEAARHRLAALQRATEERIAGSAARLDSAAARIRAR